VDALFALAYDELRRAAHRQLGRRGDGGTLSTTVLVHEAYVRLAGREPERTVDRAHFLALASRAMRCILVDHVRAATADKRGGGATRVALDGLDVGGGARDAELLALDEALQRLAARSPRLAQLVEYRFFGGLTYEEIADQVGLSVPTVKRDWVRARAWLLQAMETDA
jgi:RNA polymerase sigma factor (TIGR02999 family)